MQQKNHSNIGVLLTNLGTPTAPTTKAVRRYLAEFLADPRVVEIPRWLWWPILHGIILRVRPKRSAALYQKIWTAAGSPLLVYSQKLTQTIQQQLHAAGHTHIHLALAMRYGQPSIQHALNELKQAKIAKLIVLPLYPQYSGTTTGSTFDVVSKVLQGWRYIPETHLLSSYGDQSFFLNGLAEHIKNHWTPDPDNHLLFSFHGLPQRFVDQGDPYQLQCQITAEKIAQQLQLRPEQWTLAFQSRFGKAQWLQPYCDVTLRQLPQQGKKNVTAVCPGFAVDCLETLEEIAIQNREVFLQAGGETFNYIPALNDSAIHAEIISQLILQHV